MLYCVVLCEVLLKVIHIRRNVFTTFSQQTRGKMLLNTAVCGREVAFSKILSAAQSILHFRPSYAALIDLARQVVL